MDIATDFTNAKVWYRRNGRDWNSAGVGGFTAFYMATTLSATLTNGSLTVTSTGLSYAKSQHFRSTGKFYFEITIALWNNTSDGLGVTTLAAGYTAMTTPTTGSMMFRTTGNIYSGGTNSGKQLGVINNGDVIGVAVDLTNSKIWYRKSPSGNWNGLAIGSENPATNTGGVALPSVDVTAGLSPGVSLQTTTTPTVTANFGNSAFSGAVPAGFTAGWPNFGADAATNVGGVSIAAVLSGTTMSPAIDFSGPGTAAGEGITANFGNAAFGGAVPSGFVPGWTL
jgi:hypothetical protein